jgi:hypothetical protein
MYGGNMLVRFGEAHARGSARLVLGGFDKRCLYLV